VLVTGGGSGIGAAVVDRFAQTGATGLVLDVKAPDAIVDGWTAAVVNVRDETAIADALIAHRSSLDAIVATAGILAPWSDVAELDLGRFDEVMAVNARGLAATIKHGAPRLRDGGAIVAVASVCAWQGDALQTAYVASKHAVLGIVRSAARSLGPRGIRVNAVAPGPVATEALLSRIARRHAGGGPTVERTLAAYAGQTALGQLATVDQVASTIAFLCGEGAGAITGEMIRVDGGLG
jgi:NAD(P)-dependent dehydrogenase (short-subunit alcohol dehydrogenase family)